MLYGKKKYKGWIVKVKYQNAVLTRCNENELMKLLKNVQANIIKL